MDDPTAPAGPTEDDLARFFASPDGRRADARAAAPAAEPDDLAAFFGSPDTPGGAPPPAAPPRAPRRSRADDDLERFFGAPGARLPGGDGAFGPEPTLPAAPPRPTGPAAERRRRVGRALAGLLGLVGAVAAVGLGVVLWLAQDLPSLEQIENPRNLLATRVFTADGVELARYYEGENRTWVGLAEMSPAIPAALIATEDRRFYGHWGVDLRAIGAILKDFLTTGDARGASTITMQLARNVHAEVGRERSVWRKAREILTAIRIERTYTKPEILEAYLNTVPFLYNAYGIEAASQTFFSKTAAELDVPEAATLVGMLAANTRYDPVRNPEASRERRNVVLANMRREGALSDADYEAARAAPIALAFDVYSHEDNIAPHFAEVLRLWFREWAEANGYDPYKDGLVIRTTIDSRMQALATEALQEQGDILQRRVNVGWGGSAEDGFRYWWSRNRAVVDEYVGLSDRYTDAAGRPWSGRREDLDPALVSQLRADEAFMDSLKDVRTRLEAGLVAIEPATGRVRAWVGGRDFVANKFDHVGQARRQPGSTFKLFAYTTAFNNGYSPQSTALDAPFRWGDWAPQNSGGGYAGTVSLASALHASRNTVAARITQHFGTAEVARTAYQMGIRSPLELPPPPGSTPAEAAAWRAKCPPFAAQSNDCYARSIALGTSDISLLEMAVGYATVTNYGVYHGPTLEEERPADRSVPPHIVLAIDRIEDRYGNVIQDFTPVAREVLNPSAAYITFETMRGVIRSGTGRGLGGFRGATALDVAGKTGTTQENADGWFIAMTPQLVVGSWTGFDDRRITYPSTAVGQGGRTGLLVVGAFLQRLQAAPEGLRLDDTIDMEKPPDYEPPTRAGRIGGRGGAFLPADGRARARGGEGRPRARREDGGGGGEDRPARDMIQQFRERERPAAPAAPPAQPRPQTQGGGEGGRIGW